MRHSWRSSLVAETEGFPEVMHPVSAAFPSHPTTVAFFLCPNPLGVCEVRACTDGSTFAVWGDCAEASKREGHCLHAYRVFSTVEQHSVFVVRFSTPPPLELVTAGLADNDVHRELLLHYSLIEVL